PADPPSAVLADRAIGHGLGAGDLRERHAGAVEETEAHRDALVLDARRQPEGQRGEQDQEDHSHQEIGPLREPLALIEPRQVHLPRTSLTLPPMSAGERTTATPPASSAFIFSAAVPLPPEMMAPAWPMRRPGGAVWPAMKETTGFFRLPATQQAASSSAIPPISPISTIASVCGSSLNALRQSMKLVPVTGSPPIP